MDLDEQTIYVTLTEEDSTIRRAGGPEAYKLMERVYADCRAKLAQSNHRQVKVELRDANGDWIETFHEGPEGDDSDGDPWVPPNQGSGN